MITLAERIEVLSKLGKYLLTMDEAVQGVIELSQLKNRWFTHEYTKQAITEIAQQYLDQSWLNSFAAKYDCSPHQVKAVGLIMAGNIPAVGFHDVLCCFLSGHESIIKLSEKDGIIIPFLTKKIIDFNPAAAAYFTYVDRLKDFEAVIATGSNNSAVYFEKYFEKYPHIIRRNRNGVAVLTGNETEAELIALGKDIFDYFGLGCRSISKIYVPEDYDFEKFLEATHTYNHIVNHSKYKNNFDYNYALLILNVEKFLNNGCLLLREDNQIASRISTMHYEYYADHKQLEDQLVAALDKIQCICTQASFDRLETIPLGTAQKPELDRFADNVDTMKFLTAL